MLDYNLLCWVLAGSLGSSHRHHLFILLWSFRLFSMLLSEITTSINDRIINQETAWTIWYHNNCVTCKLLMLYLQLMRHCIFHILNWPVFESCSAPPISFEICEFYILGILLYSFGTKKWQYRRRKEHVLWIW